MRAASGVHVEWVQHEAVVLDSSSGELHYLNPPSALAYALILEHGFEEAMETLRARYSGAPGFEDELDGLIADMVDKGLLVND